MTAEQMRALPIVIAEKQSRRFGSDGEHLLTALLCCLASFANLGWNCNGTKGHLGF